MLRLTTIAEVRAHVADARLSGRRVALVPTMGALHEGHLALVELAAEQADTVVVSVFVNPTQFDRADDLAAYPRDLARDEQALAALPTSAPVAVFAPALAEIYPRASLTTVHVAGLTDRLCGASRPGHFDGVATVVTKLLAIVGPDVAVFGRKDRQQLAVVERLVADLNLPVRIVAGPTVREPDGLARSSRNRRLDPAQRATARALPLALRDAVLAARAAGGVPARPLAAMRAAALARLAVDGLEVDYLEVVDPATFAPPGPEPTGTLVVAVAAQLGPVRLIDNVEVGDPHDEARLLDAVGS